MAVTKATTSTKQDVKRQNRKPTPKPAPTPEPRESNAQQVVDVYAPRVAALLGVPVPKNIEIKWLPDAAVRNMLGLEPDEGVAGFAQPGAITLNADSVKTMGEEEFQGLVVHELAHVMLNLPSLSGENTKAFVEGLADYARDALVHNQSNPDGRIRQGYQGAAAFFQFIEDQQPGSVKALVASLHQEQEAPLVAATGMDFDGWVQRYREIQRPQPIPNMPDWNGPGTFGEWWRDVKKVQRENRRGYTPEPPRLTPHFAEGYGPEVNLDGTVGDSNVDEEKIGALGIIGLDERPTSGPIVIGSPPGDSNSGSSSSSSSSGGSSGGGGASGPKVDVYVSDQFKQDAVKRQKMQMFAQLYQQLWGEPATESYLMQAVNSGMNTWEFAEQERSKPAFSKTETYKKKAQSLADVLLGWGA